MIAWYGLLTKSRTYIRLLSYSDNSRVMTRYITPPAGAILDMHCHTTVGSGDSQLTPHQLAAAAKVRMLTACCVTEHDYLWSPEEVQRQSRDQDVTCIRGMEVTTNLGHVITYSLDYFHPNMVDARVLRQAVSAADGIMIAAHPFRNTLISPTSEQNNVGPLFHSVKEAVSTPLLNLVDEIEVLNGGTEPIENFLALSVARHLGFRGVAGSDAHTELWVGKCATAFHDPVTTVNALVRQIKAGQFFIIQTMEPVLSGRMPYTWEETSLMLEPQLQAVLASPA